MQILIHVAEGHYNSFSEGAFGNLCLHLLLCGKHALQLGSRLPLRLSYHHKSLSKTRPVVTFTTTIEKMRSATNDILPPGLFYGREFLRSQAHKIRDVLDVDVAREGPDVLHSNDLLKIDEFLRKLAKSSYAIEDLRYSRIHLAILEIASKGTRWPSRVVERCDAIKDAWEAVHGPLVKIGILLYEPGGRLNGVCTPDDVGKERLLARWMKSSSAKLSPVVARRVGDLDFRPGERVAIIVPHLKLMWR